LRDAVHRKNVLSLEEAQQIVAKVQPNFAHDDIAAVELYSSAVERYENGEFAIAAKDFQRCAQLAERGSSMKDIVADFRKRQAACESLGASCPANWSPILAGEK
jgi:hypothetical protein